MKNICLILLQVICLQLVAQKVNKEFGKFSEEEKNMTIYDKAPEAKAVVLYDKGESSFFPEENDFNVLFKRHKRIKILDKSAAQYGEITIPYIEVSKEQREKILSIEAITWNNVDGKMVPKTVNPFNIFDETINGDWKQKKFVFPDIQDGSILELRYSIESPFKFYFKDWYFQQTIPTKYSEYEVRMIPFYEYNFLVTGTSKFDYTNSTLSPQTFDFQFKRRAARGYVEFNHSYQENIHTYVMKDVPAFDDENYISSIQDYVLKMDFQLARYISPDGVTEDFVLTWNKINELLMEHENFGEYYKDCSKYAARLLSEELNVAGDDKMLASKKIIDFVKSNFSWNEYNNVYSSQSAKNFYENRVGNSADINLFLVALLNEAGIAAKPVISSTRKHGKIIKSYPSVSATNYVTALVNTRTPFLADATEKLLPYNKLPFRCLSNEGLVIEADKKVKEEDEMDWINMNYGIKGMSKNLIFLEVDTATNNLQTRVSIKNVDYEAYQVRKAFADNDAAIKEHYKDEVGEVSMLVTKGYDKLDGIYSVNMKSTYETEWLNDNIIIKPFLNLPINYELSSQKERKYPVDFIYSSNDEFESTLKLPAGYTITNLPEGIAINNAMVDINLSYTLQNNTLKTKGKYEFKKSLYEPAEYKQLKSYFEKIAEKFNESVILKKGGSDLSSKSK